MMCTAKGDLDGAFRWLEAAREQHIVWTVPILRSPLYRDSLAGARYDALLRTLNLG